MADVDEDSDFVMRPLQLNDLPFAVALEESSFPPNEAATPEKVYGPRQSTNRRLSIAFALVLT
jgi:hypothetical protein